MTNAYALLLNCNPRNVPIEKIERQLNQAKDWGRMAPNIWFFNTNLTQEEWYDRIKPVLDPTDSILIVSISMQYYKGWVYQPIIEWFQRDKEGRPGA